MFVSIFRPHLYAACAKFRVKRVSACIYGTTYDRYIYENSTVRLASVGLAQARPNEVVVLQSYKLSANILNVLTHPNHVGSHYTFYMLVLFWAAAVLKFVEQSTANEVGKVIILWTLLHSESFLAC